MRINENITEHSVRLIGADGDQLGVMPIEQALARASSSRLDLVEVAPKASPPVCKLLDYGKHKYRENKKRHEARAAQKHIEVKEVKFRISISDGDYLVKARNIRRFLGDGNRVKVSLWFRGREIVHKHLGQRLLDRVIADFEEEASIEQPPAMEGRRLIMVLAPKKSKPKQRSPNAQDENQ